MVSVTYGKICGGVPEHISLLYGTCVPKWLTSPKVSGFLCCGNHIRCITCCMTHLCLLQVAGFALPADKRIKEKIADFVDDGVFAVSEMRRHVTHYVRTDLFAGQTLPEPSDRRFFPTAVDYRNYIYRARVSKLHSKIDQVNLAANIEKWKVAHPEDSFFFHEYSEENVCSECNDMNDEHDDVLLESSNRETGLLFCHQTKWQKHLLNRYGHEICLLDATYKTSRYALPLFFVCVKTNVNYCTAASFIVQSEDTRSISEAIQVIKLWNPAWQPENWMVDFCEAEINALETAFPGTLAV